MEWYWILVIIIGSIAALLVLSTLLYKQFFKRFYDIVLSGIALIVHSPLFIILIIVGAIVMKGNPFFVQQPSFGQIVLDAYKMGTLILASDELLEDSGADIEKLILEQFSRRIGKCEEEAFLTGDGNHKPIGLRLCTIIGYVNTLLATVSLLRTWQKGEQLMRHIAEKTSSASLFSK